jgi:replicative DNA helicase
MHAARTQPVAFFSVEMARQPVGLRSVIAAAQVDGFRFLSGFLGELEMMRVGDGLSQLASASIYFDESPMLSPIHVRSKLRRLVAKTGPPALVVIDYLQLMAALPDDRRENKTNQVAGISRALKLLAREFGVPFLVLAQLNRAVERSTDKRPTLSDLRDSGAVEQDADVVLLLYRPEMYERDKPELQGVAEVIVGKQRNGPTGTVSLAFHKSQMRFESAEAR